VHRYVNDLEFFRFSLHNAHRLFFFSFTERFCIDNARVIDGKIGYMKFEEQEHEIGVSLYLAGGGGSGMRLVRGA
jgi:hypothetical protein